MASILQEAKAHAAFSSLLARGEQTQILLLEICGCLSARQKSWTCRDHHTPSRSSEIPGIRQVQGKRGQRG